MGNIELAAFGKRQYIIFKAVTPARFVAATILMRGRNTSGSALQNGSDVSSLGMFALHRFTSTLVSLSWHCYSNLANSPICRWHYSHCAGLWKGASRLYGVPRK